MTGPPLRGNPEFEAIRQAAREAGRDLQRSFEADGDPFGWFEALYRRAEGQWAAVPWADAAPRAKLEEWLVRAGTPWGAGRAVDIGCGLGDNAQQLARAGWTVTAFDISATAVAWARSRFAGSAVAYRVADLFAPPSDWIGRFDLVHETYNLQAMPPGRVGEAIGHVAALAARGGAVLVMCRGRDVAEEVDGPPWPLAWEELGPFARAGLEQVRFEEFYDERDPPVRHFLVEYRRPA